MRIKEVILTILTGLSLAMILFLATIAQADAAGTAQEAMLNSDGAAYEINADSTGQFLISDLDAGEIWQVNPATGAYTVFKGIPSPSDARRDSTGMVWWGDWNEGRFGRLNPSTAMATWWVVPGVAGLWGTQIDPVSGDFWFVGNEEPYLFRFQPADNQLCTYTLPLNGVAYYPKMHDGMLWLGDANNSRLIKLNPVSDSATIWNLPESSAPEGMAFDTNNALWFAESTFGSLMRFQPDTNQLDTFDLPVGLSPEMIAIQGDRVWYTEIFSATVGRLDPATAIHASTTLIPGTQTIPSSCGEITPTDPIPIPVDHGVLTWSEQSYPTLVDSGGWRVYQLPEPEISLPWGVAVHATQAWYVDSGRQVLGRLENRIFLPLVIR